jgi:hypothetical protein
MELKGHLHPQDHKVQQGFKVLKVLKVLRAQKLVQQGFKELKALKVLLGT